MSELEKMAGVVIESDDELKARGMLGNLRRMQTDMNAAIRALIVYLARKSGYEIDHAALHETRDHVEVQE